MNQELTDVTPDVDKIRELCLKIKELHERGEEHERDVAGDMLEKIIAKYGLTLEDVSDLKSLKREFKINDFEDEVAILSQCIWDVNPSADVKMQKVKKLVLVSLTSAQFIEVTEKFKYFWELYLKQKDQFLTAFIVKNKLGLENDSNSDAKITKDEATEIAQMSDAIKKGEFYDPTLLDDSTLGQENNSPHIRDDSTLENEIIANKNISVMNFDTKNIQHEE